MAMIRWPSGPADTVVIAGSGGGAGRPRPADVDAWLDAIHRLAVGRVAERRGIASAGETTRARLQATE
jgi:hypothetical protein